MLLSDRSESVLPQQVPSDCDRHHDHQRRTGKAPVPRPIPIVVIMPPHTTRLHVFTHSDAAIPIPSAVQQPGRLRDSQRSRAAVEGVFTPIAMSAPRDRRGTGHSVGKGAIRS